MITWPASDKLSKTAVGTLERFKKTAAAKELEQDARAWSFISWAWLPEAPYAFTLRSADHEERQYVVEGDGRWQMKVLHPARNVA